MATTGRRSGSADARDSAVAATPVPADLGPPAMKAVVDASWDSTAWMLAYVHELSHVQVTAFSALGKLFDKAAGDIAKAADFEDLLRANMTLGQAIVAEATTLGREFMDRTIEAQSAAAAAYPGGDPARERPGEAR